MSRIVKVIIGGTATPGDVVNLSYSAARGGKTAAGHIVAEGQSLADVAAGLAAAVNTHWCQGLFSAQASGEAILIICEIGAQDVSVTADVEHIAGEHHWIRAPGGSETVTIEAA